MTIRAALERIDAILTELPQSAKTPLTRIAAGLRTRRPGTGRRRLAASGLFDPQGYLTAYPDVRASGLDPLDHFMLYGWREGRDPNPLFTVRWYLSNNPDVAALGTNPLLHYVDVGERQGREASPTFSPRYYAHRYADVAGAGRGLLAHYIDHGRAEGRSGVASLAPDAGEPVADARVAVVKPFGDVRDGCVALLVCHAADGRLKPHVGAYVEALTRAGYAVGLIAMTDAPFHADEGVVDSVAGLYVRENRGLDFAAWAHLLRLEPQLFAARALLFANDSVLPRAGPDALSDVLGAMEASDADLVGLTDSYEVEWHVQSYFMLAKPRALASVAFQRFMFDVRMLDTKDEVIGLYEFRFASALRGANLRCAALYPSTGKGNPTIQDWRRLLASGFPFVKIALLQGRDASAETTGLDAALRSFDPAHLVALRSSPARAPSAADALLDEATRALSERLRPAARHLKIDFIGAWAGADASAEASRRLVAAWWRTDLQVNLRPRRGPVDGVEAIEFDGPADVAVVHLHEGLAPPLDAVAQAAVDRAGLRIGVIVDGADAAWPQADAVWVLGEAPHGLQGGVPVFAIPDLDGCDFMDAVAGTMGESASPSEAGLHAVGPSP